MISVEPRPVATLNVVTRSGLTTHIQDTPTLPVEALIRKAPEKIPAFDIFREKETFMAAKKDFAGPSPSSVPAQLHSPPYDTLIDKESVLSTFLHSSA